MKRLFTALLSLVAIVAMAQPPSVTATVSGQVTYSETQQPAAGYILKVMMYSYDSTGTAMFSEVYTDENGHYSVTGTIESSEGVIEVSTSTCNGSIETQSFTVSQNAPNVFNADFIVCNELNCMAEFSYFSTGALTYQFINQSLGGDDLSFIWSFGDGTMSFEENPIKTYEESGVYLVILTIYSPDSSCYSNAQMYIATGTEFCKAGFFWETDTTSNLTLHYKDLSYGNPSFWHWDFGDGTYSTEQNPVHNYAAEGFYIVCLTISNDDSTCYSYFCENVIVGTNTACIAQFTYYPESFEDPTALRFADLSYGEFTDWHWDFGDGTESFEQDPLHYFPGPGIYKVCLTASGPECQSTWCEQVSVLDSISGCSNYFTYKSIGNSVQFFGTQLNNLPSEYYWEFGDGNSATGASVVHTYSQSGIYFVSLKTVDETGCVGISGQSVVVGDTMMFNQVYGQVFKGNFPLTSGFVMIFSVESDTNYYPYFDLALVDQMGVYVFPTVPNGNYNLLAIPTDGSNYLPTYYQSTLFWQEATSINSAQNGSPLNIQLQTVQGNATQGICNINGKINQGNIRNSFIGQIIVYLTDSDHKILQFTRVNDNGEFSFNNLTYGTYYIKPELAGVYSDYQQVVLSGENTQVSVTLTFTGNSILGEPDKSSLLTDVSVYPNPAQETTRIAWSSTKSKSVSITICDLSGRSLITQSQLLHSGQSGIDLSLGTLQKGVYLMRIRFDDGSEVSKKIVKN